MESYKFEIINMGNLPKIEKPKIKKYEIWIGFVGAFGQGEHDSVKPRKLGEAEGTSFKIACCIYEHESEVKRLKERMERGDDYIEDMWFGHWGYNPKDNSTMHLGKYFENEKDAWTTFK